LKRIRQHLDVSGLSKQCRGTGTAGTVTFALAEPKLECITVPVSDPVPEPDLDPDPISNVIKKIF
jgi:hypothetical protein